MSPSVFMESWAKPVLVLHALVALASLGASSQLVWVAIQLYLGRKFDRLIRLYSRLLGGSYGAAFLLGLLMYPHYRVHVRGWYLDRYEPWASNLFDMKENLAALAIPIGLSVILIGWRWDSSRDAVLRFPLVVLATMLWLTILGVSVSGLIVTDTRGV